MPPATPLRPCPGYLAGAFCLVSSFKTMPSSPRVQAWRTMALLSSSRCSEAERLACAPEGLAQPRPALLNGQRARVLAVEAQQVEGEQTCASPAVAP